MNRRDLLVGGVSGAALGSAWVAGFGLLLRRQEPILSVIGVGESLLALLDAGNVRVLVAAGPGDPRLSRNLDSLLGVFRPRFDLLVGSESGLAEFTPRVLTRHGNPRRMILDRPTGIAFGPQGATGPPVLLGRLPKGIDMRLSVSIQNAWQPGSTPSQAWIVTFSMNGHQSAIADSLSVVERYGDPDLDLGIVGSLDRNLPWDMSRDLPLVVPATQVKAEAVGDTTPPPFLLFPRHPLSIAFRKDGLALRK